MQQSQQRNKTIFFIKASHRQRLTAAAITAAILALFGFLNLAANGIINTDRLFNPCGFKQRYSLPCPTCGMTTAAKVFADGKILHAFYIQPAGAFLCLILAVTAFLASITAVFGVYLGFLWRFLTEVKVRYFVIALLIIIAGGWAVTFARALAERN